MKTEVTWADRIPERDEYANHVNCVAFRPDGMQLLVAVGNRVLVFDANDGELVMSLKGHKDIVYCVAYAKDGKRFASGGADKNIIIWTRKAEAILKYSHGDSIQCLAYNPVTHQLASGTESDFGLWSPEQKSVQKIKMPSKVLSASWTNDGQYIALGMFNGTVSIRGKTGNERLKIERSAPIFTLSWAPVPRDSVAVDTLAVGCWDQTLSFYQLSGKQIGVDKKLEYDPTSLDFFDDGKYILIGGSGRKVQVYTSGGIFLKDVAQKEEWLWSIKARPKSRYFAVGANNGGISMHQNIFNTVHGLYQDRYAHRDNMTDVILQHLVSEQKVRIKCKDYVKKIAVFKDRLAVQLPDRILVYETIQNDPMDMHYRLKEKINRSLECNLLVVTSENVILCLEKKLQLFDFRGNKEREWVLDAVIRYIRVVGGPSGREGLLVGLKSGSVVKIFIDNQFPIQLIQHSSPIRCLDLSANRKKLAVVDENSKVYIYNLLTKEIEFEEFNANSVSWNSEMDEMFCYSGGGQLSIKTGNFPIHKQSLQGFVVGFKGSKVFCLHYLAMQTIDVPQSASMFRYVAEEDYDRAYEIACLGVTQSDWRGLAMAALTGLNLEVAHKAFIRVRDIRYIELLNKIEIARKDPNHNDTMFLADIKAYQGKFDEAARLYCNIGHHKKAIEMYLDLRMWDKAKALMEQYDETGDLPAGASSEKTSGKMNMVNILREQATWVMDSDELAAANMYWGAKDFVAAIKLFGDNEWLDAMMEKVRTLGKMQRKEIELAAAYCRKYKNHEYAKELYLKINDVESIVQLSIELQRWEEAFNLAQGRPDLLEAIYLPYAEWLAYHDRFDEAHDAFTRAGRPDDAYRLLCHLRDNAVVEHRFADAAFYHWQLSRELLKELRLYTEGGDIPDDILAKNYADFVSNYHKAAVYAAFDSIYRYTEEPFTSLQPFAIFQAAQYVLNHTPGAGDTKLAAASVRNGEETWTDPWVLSSPAKGVSTVFCLYALARQGTALGAYKLARVAYERLLKYKIRESWREQIDHSALLVRTKPFSDKETLMPVCYRCSASNPILSEGDLCVQCQHPFIRSLLSFEILPLVEFVIAPDITPDEARELIAKDPPRKYRASASIDGGSREGSQQIEDNMQVLTLGDDDGDRYDSGRNGGGGAIEPFQNQLMNIEQDIDGSVRPIVLDREGLLASPPDSVFIRQFKGVSPDLLPPHYFRSVVDEVPIQMCDSCLQFFHEEDYEFHVLQHGSCPFCKTKLEI